MSNLEGFELLGDAAEKDETAQTDQKDKSFVILLGDDDNNIGDANAPEPEGQQNDGSFVILLGDTDATDSDNTTAPNSNSWCITGDMTIETVTRLFGEYQALQQTSAATLAIDLTAAGRCDTAGAQLLVAIAKSLSDAGTDPEWLNVPDQLANTLSLLDYDRLPGMPADGAEQAA